MSFKPADSGHSDLRRGITLSDKDRNELETVVRTGSQPAALRARIVLLAADGWTNSAITHETGASRTQVYYWKKRFRQGGLIALHQPHEPYEPSQNEISEPEKKPGKKKSTDRPGKQKNKPLAADKLIEKGEETEINGQSLVQPRPELGLLPTDTLAEAGKKVFSFFLARMLEHEAGTRLGEDIEELHDMRVATRRMRAAFDIFGAAFKPDDARIYLKGLRSTGRALGTVRDWDVFLEKADRDIHHLGDEDQLNLVSLLERWRSERQACREAMLAYLDSSTYRQFVERFNKFVQTPGLHELKIRHGEFDGQPVPTVHTLAHLAPVLIYTRLGAVRAFAGLIPHAKIVQLHALRIEFKRLHYVLDFLKEILGPEAKIVLAAVKRMQDHLGDLNDADVACLRLGGVLENWEISQVSTPLAERQTPSSLLAYLSLKHAQRHDLLVSFPAAWEAFDTVELRQQLASAIAVL